MHRFRNILIVILFSTVMLSGCDLPGLGGGSGKNVKITALATSESQIMAHMIRLQIEHDTHGKVKPTIINNLGSATIEHNTLKRGDAQISATRYTGTDLVGALDHKPITDTDKAMHVVQKGFKDKFNQTFFNSYGFENTFAFMVTQEVAKKYHLEKVSDLEKHKDDLRLGTDSTWVKRAGDGYPAFTKAYGFKFKTVRPMQIGLVYDALKNKKLDVALGYTTDGRIAAYKLKVLKDDRHFFPPYDASPLAKNDFLKKNPEIKKSLEKLQGKVSTQQMQKLNYQSDGQQKEPAVVAEKFLKKHHYFENE
ncbi:osmoprotectant ABC transporter substrate-binding protein [Staphylococcus debuckii]|uniref:osmoprotectant ABC transporter substrate-binding protein n=1 Tax=Staphylococcus debuckii TaxID=2044912 RepID=UPI000F4310DC|nr:osmoprotectant ABC transporter substrate-binding protein [Staphylococcus debuckii]AYU54328.1 osmoprotectant ABC transporter substrate-binding protein [Staphylococcus debuckii]